MTLSIGIEEQAARSLTSVHDAPSPRPSIELRRVKHIHDESVTRGVANVRGDDSKRYSTKRDQTQAVSPNARKRLEVQYACLCLALFLAGWNDGTNGPLIPRIRRYYNVRLSTTSVRSSFLSDRMQVNFTLVSLIFIANCIVSIQSERGTNGSEHLIGIRCWGDRKRHSHIQSGIWESECQS